MQEQQFPFPPPRKLTPREEEEGREGGKEGEGEDEEKLDADHFMSIIPKITKNQEGKKGVRE